MWCAYNSIECVHVKLQDMTWIHYMYGLTGPPGIGGPPMGGRKFGGGIPGGGCAICIGIPGGPIPGRIMGMAGIGGLPGGPVMGTGFGGGGPRGGGWPGTGPLAVRYLRSWLLISSWRWKISYEFEKSTRSWWCSCACTSDRDYSTIQTTKQYKSHQNNPTQMGYYQQQLLTHWRDRNLGILKPKNKYQATYCMRLTKHRRVHSAAA